MKKVLIAFAGLIGLLVAAALVAPNFVDWNAYKPQIVAAAEKFTGRALRIEGDIDLALLPTPALSVAGVRLASIEGAQSPDLVRLDELQVRVDIGALLEGRLAVESVSLIRPVIALEVTGDGRRSWDIAPPPPRTPSEPAVGAGTSEAPGPAAPTTGEGGGFSVDVSLARLRIENGILVYRDAGSGTEERIEDLAAQISADSLEGPFRFEGTATVRGIPVALDVSAGRVATAQPLALTVKLETGEGQGKVRFSGRLSEPSANGRLEGRLEISASDLADLAARLGGGVLPGILARPFSLEGSLKASREAIALNDLGLEFGGIDATGALDAKLGEVPEIDLALRIARLDLDAFLSSAAGKRADGMRSTEAGANAGATNRRKTGTKGDDAAGAAAPGEGDRLPDLPKNVNVSLDVVAEVVEYRGGVVREVTLRGSLGNGSVVLERASALLPGGSDASVSGVFQIADGVPRFEGEATATSDNLRNLLAWAGVESEKLPPDRLHSFSYASKVKIRGRTLEATDIGIRLDASRITGGLALELRQKPAFGLRLVVDRLNLDAYLPKQNESVVDRGQGTASPGKKDGAAKSDVSAGKSTTESERKPSVPAGVAGFLDAFDANIEATVGRLTYKGVTARVAHADLTVFGGEITLRDLSVADFAGVDGRISGTLRGLRASPSVILDFSVRANDPARFLRYVGFVSPLPEKKLGTPSVKGRVVGTLESAKIEGEILLAGGKLTLDGVAKGLLSAPTFEAGVAVNHPELRQLLRLVAPDYRPAARKLGPLEIAFRAAGTPVSARISEVKGTVGPVAVEGGIELAFGPGRPAVRADIATGEVLLDLFLPPSPPRRPGAERVRSSRAAQPGGQPRVAARGVDARWSRKPVVLPLPPGFDLELTLEMAALTKDPVRMVAPRLHAVWKNGRLTLDRLEGRLFEGVVDANAVVDIGSGVPDVTARFTIKKLDTGAAVGALFGLDRVRGPLSLEADLRSRGHSEAALVRALNGTVSLSGRLQVVLTKNERAAADAAGLANLATALFGGKVAALRRLTPFTQLIVALDQTLGRSAAHLNGDIVATDGVLRTENLTLLGAGGRATTRATIDLPRWRLDSYTELVGREGGAPLLTYAMSGPLDNPSRTKLGGSLIQSGKAAAQAAPGGILQRLLPKVPGLTTPSREQPASPPPAQKETPSQQEQKKVQPEEMLRGLFKGLLR